MVESGLDTPNRAEQSKTTGQIKAKDKEYKEDALTQEQKTTELKEHNAAQQSQLSTLRKQEEKLDEKPKATMMDICFV